MPTLSVIIACRDSAAYLEACLDSVLAQTCRDLEIVVWDDGSRDQSPAIARAYARRHPGVVRSLGCSASLGVAAARQAALAEARGAFITTLDSDDYYLDPGKLAAELALAQAGKARRSRDIVAFSDILLVDRDGTARGPWSASRPLREGLLFEAILTRSCLIPRDFVLARALLEQVGGYDPGLPIYEDWDLKLRLARACEFRYTGLIGSAYRQTGSGLSAQPAATHVRWLQEIFARHVDHVPAARRDEARRVFAGFLNGLAHPGSGAA
jgi:glycosyltransferase involved in cell wall biosynthesis